jgi:hypothetical protein
VADQNSGKEGSLEGDLADVGEGEAAAGGVEEPSEGAYRSLRA